MSPPSGPAQAERDRFAAGLRVFDTNGIERAAWGWDRHERRGLDAYHAAERAALAAIEKRDLGPRWEEFRRALFGLTEAPGALVNWKAPHGQLGPNAESAEFGPALALLPRTEITHDHYATLVDTIPAALPCLLAA